MFLLFLNRIERKSRWKKREKAHCLDFGLAWRELTSVIHSSLIAWQPKNVWSERKAGYFYTEKSNRRSPSTCRARDETVYRTTTTLDVMNAVTEEESHTIIGLVVLDRWQGAWRCISRRWRKKHENQHVIVTDRQIQMCSRLTWFSPEFWMITKSTNRGFWFQSPLTGRMYNHEQRKSLKQSIRFSDTLIRELVTCSSVLSPSAILELQQRHQVIAVSGHWAFLLPRSRYPCRNEQTPLLLFDFVHRNTSSPDRPLRTILRIFANDVLEWISFTSRVWTTVSDLRSIPRRTKFIGLQQRLHQLAMLVVAWTPCRFTGFPGDYFTSDIHTPQNLARNTQRTSGGRAFHVRLDRQTDSFDELTWQNEE